MRNGLYRPLGDAAEVLNQLVRQHEAPKYLFADNGAEFAGRLVDLRAYQHGVRIDFSRPGKPTDNAYIETFLGSFRDQCLNLHWFASIAEAQRLIEACIGMQREPSSQGSWAHRHAHITDDYVDQTNELPCSWRNPKTYEATDWYQFVEGVKAHQNAGWDILVAENLPGLDAPGM